MGVLPRRAFAFERRHGDRRLVIKLNQDDGTMDSVVENSLAFIQGSFVGSKGPKSGDIGKAILLFNQTFPIGMMGWYLVFFLALPGLGAGGQVFKKRIIQLWRH